MKVFHLVILFLILNFFTGVNTGSSPDDELLKIFSDMEEYNLRTYPEGATYNGDNRYDDKLSDNSEAAVFEYYDTIRAYMSRLNSIEYNNLSEANKLNYDLFKSSMEENLAGEKFKGYLMPMGQQWGIHINSPQIVNYQPVSTYEEYQKYFSRLRQLESKFDNTISNMRKGIAEGYVMPVFLMDQTLPQIEKIIVTDPEQSVFYSTLKKENKLSAEEKLLVENELKEIITTVINPSYKKLYEFVKTEYLPACRTEAGVWAIPNGKEMYEYSIKNYTTLDLTADEIHNIGLSEVARINTEMEKSKRSGRI